MLVKFTQADDRRDKKAKCVHLAVAEVAMTANQGVKMRQFHNQHFWDGFQEIQS